LNPVVFYQKFTPSPVLAPFVECYYVWESRRLITAIAPVVVESPPNGFGSLVFNFGEPYAVESPRRGLTIVSNAFIVGQSTRQYKLHLMGPINMVGVVFKPAGLGSLFGLPMHEFADERIEARAVLGQSISNLFDQVADYQLINERIACIEQFLLCQLLKRDIRPDRLDYTANLIVQHKGIVHMPTLVDDAFLCRRQFERKFLQRVGVSPKFYARIRRVGYLCSVMAANNWQVSDWHDLVIGAGYYDQSHFIREFTEFTGKAPSLYVRNNVELSQYLRG
jgi:AraC-like DNA-binding protein